MIKINLINHLKYNQKHSKKQMNSNKLKFRKPNLQNYWKAMIISLSPIHLSLIKENAAKFSVAHTQTSPITQRTCATIATIVLVNQNWHMPVDIPIKPIIQVVCVKTAILPNTIKRIKEREMKRSNKKIFQRKAKSWNIKI